MKNPLKNYRQKIKVQKVSSNYLIKWKYEEKDKIGQEGELIVDNLSKAKKFVKKYFNYVIIDCRNLSKQRIIEYKGIYEVLTVIDKYKK